MKPSLRQNIRNLQREGLFSPRKILTNLAFPDTINNCLFAAKEVRSLDTFLRVKKLNKY